MDKLKITDDSRITFDEATGAVRSFFGGDLVESQVTPGAAAVGVAPGAVKSTRQKCQEFLEASKDAFKLEGVSLRQVRERRGAATNAVTYVQEHRGIPVFGANFVVGVEQASNKVASAVNKVDYTMPAELKPESVRVPAEEVPQLVQRHLRSPSLHGQRQAAFSASKEVFYVSAPHPVDRAADAGHPRRPTSGSRSRAGRSNEQY